MEEKQILRMHALAHRVLAVAVCNYEDSDAEGSLLRDWAVYIDAVKGFDHEAEKEAVAQMGDKQPREIAILLFPYLDIEKYRR